jgi:hypothetical protein
LSPPRSNRGAKPAKAAPAAKAKTRAGSGSTRSSSPGLWDEYHTLLAVSLGAIVIGALMLVLVLNKYGFDTSAKGGSAQNAPSLTQSVA